MIYFILALFIIIIIEAMVITILALILKNKNVRQIETANKRMTAKITDTAKLESEIEAKKENANEKIENAENIDDVKSVFIGL